MKVVGVLALQGAVTEHLTMLGQLQVKGVAVKQNKDFDELDALIIPGGESTVISRLIKQQGLYDVIQTFAKSKPVMGTCAGLILCANTIINDDGKITPLKLIDITVRRNGFGRQINSCEAQLSIKGIGSAILSVFIRAPFIEAVGKDVVVLARLDEKIVMAEQGNILVMAFHPELTSDTRIFEYFINKIK